MVSLLKPLKAKIAEISDVVYIQFSSCVVTLCFATHLAGKIIAFACESLLSCPVRSIVVLASSTPQRMIAPCGARQTVYMSTTSYPMTSITAKPGFSFPDFNRSGIERGVAYFASYYGACAYHTIPGSQGVINKSGIRKHGFIVTKRQSMSFQMMIIDLLESIAADEAGYKVIPWYTAHCLILSYRFRPRLGRLQPRQGIILSHYTTSV